jgi:hypothetical protein
METDILLCDASVNQRDEYQLVIDLVTHKKVNRQPLPSEVEAGFSFNHIRNELKILDASGKEILKFDVSSKQSLPITVINDANNFNQALAELTYFAVIVLCNPVTNKVYALDIVRVY